MKIGAEAVDQVGRVVIANYKSIRPMTAADAEMNRQTAYGLSEWFKQSDRLISPAASTCISRFVASEMDATTAGLRGMGRSDEKLPRFAGKYRTYVQSLTDAERTELCKSFSLAMLSGYLMVECCMQWLLRQEMPRHATMGNGEVLLHRFIPHVFVPASSKEFDRVMTGAMGSEQQYIFIKTLWAAAFGEDILRFWGRTGLTVADYENYVVSYLFHAGIALRMVEWNPGTDDQHKDIITGGAWSMNMDHPELVEGKTGCLIIMTIAGTAFVSAFVLLA